MTSRYRLTLSLLACLAGLLPGWGAVGEARGAGAPASEPLQVLASYHRGNPWNDELVQRLGEATERLGVPLEVDYLDARRLAEAQAFQLQRSRLAGRRAVTPGDRLLLLDDAALRFYLTHAEALGEPQRVLALGINEPALRRRAAERGVRLVAYRPVAEDSLRFLVELFGPSLPLLVLGDDTEVGRALTRGFLESLATVEGASAVDVLWQWDPARVRETLARAPAGTRVYLVEGQTTGAGDLGREARNWLPALEAAGVPVFCHLPYQVDLGCAGGAILDTRRLAQLAVESLAGNAFEQLPGSLEVEATRRQLHASFYPRLSAASRERVDAWLAVEETLGSLDTQRRWSVAGWVAVGLLGVGLTLLAASRWRMRRRLLIDATTGLPSRQALENAFVNDAPEQDGWLFTLFCPGLRGFRQRLGSEAALGVYREQLRLLRRLLPSGWRLYAGSEFTLLGRIPAGHAARAESDFDALLARFETAREEGGGPRLAWYASLLPLAGHRAGLAQCWAALDDGLLRLERQGWRQPVIRVSPMPRGVATRFRRLADDLEALIEAPEPQWRLVIQPRVYPADGRLLGGEVLLRWDHPSLGEISPREFLPIVEVLGLTARLDAWVMARSLAWFAAPRPGAVLPILAINVNLASLEGPGFITALDEQLRRHGLDPRRLELEITEHADFSDPERVAQTLKALERLGVRLALDDFGTGRTAFQLLQRLPLSTVKLDRDLLYAAGREPRAREAYVALVRFCEQLGLDTVAEGVENGAQAEWLSELGVTEVQGFFYARPMALDVLLAGYAPSSSMAP